MKYNYLLVFLLILCGCVSTQQPQLKENPEQYTEFHKWSSVKSYDISVLKKFTNMSPEEINSKINEIKYARDSKTYGVTDYWASPQEFFERNRGDCEDYAIAKYAAFKHSGQNVSDTYVAVVIKKDGEGHAVLIHNNMVYDNETDEIKTLMESKKDFKIMYMINEKTVWTI